jgi:hypothetical protein
MFMQDNNTHVFVKCDKNHQEGALVGQEPSGRGTGWPECETETFWRAGRRIHPQM